MVPPTMQDILEVIRVMAALAWSDGVLDSAVLWNTKDLGYLTVYAANAAATGALKPGAPSLSAGRLGPVKVEGDQVILGTPFTFTKDNVDQFDF